MSNRSHITINTVPRLYCIVLLIPLIQIEEVFFSWLLSMVACWAWSAGYEVAESGADLDLVIFSPIFCFLFWSSHLNLEKITTNLMSNQQFYLPSLNTRTFCWCPTTRLVHIIHLSIWDKTSNIHIGHIFVPSHFLTSHLFQSTADVPLLMTIFSSRVGFCNKVDMLRRTHHLHTSHFSSTHTYLHCHQSLS